ncbi:MAG: hypothetical protein ACHQ1E_12495, partial [Ktedonobacterales bacterium]
MVGSEAESCAAPTRASICPSDGLLRQRAGRREGERVQELAFAPILRFAAFARQTEAAMRLD